MLVSAVCCPKCRTSLAVPRPVPPGTPMDCPRCLLTFRTPPPLPGDAVIDDVEVVDEYDDIPVVEAVDEEVKPAPVRSRRRPPPAYRLADGTPRFRKRRPKSTNWAGIAVVAVAAVAVLGGLVGLAVWLLGGGPGDDPLAFVPPDTQVVVGVRIGDLAREVPAIGQALEQQLLGPAGGAISKDDFGIDGRDVFDQMTIALTQDGTKVTAVTKSRIPFDRRRVTGRRHEGMTKVSAFGQSYFRADAPTSPFKTLYCPNNRIFVITALADQELKPILKSDGKKASLAGPMAALAGKLSAHHAWTVFTPDGLRGPLANAPGGPTTAPGLDELSRTAQAVAVWASVQNGTVDVHIGLQCADDATAQQAVTKMQAEMPQMFTALEAVGLFRPAVKALAAELRASAKVAAQGPLAEMSAQVGVATLEGLAPEIQRLAGGMP